MYCLTLTVVQDGFIFVIGCQNSVTKWIDNDFQKCGAEMDCSKDVDKNNKKWTKTKNCAVSKML